MNNNMNSNMNNNSMRNMNNMNTNMTFNISKPNYNDDNEVGTNELYDKLNDIISLNSKKHPENRMKSLKKNFEIDMNN